MKTNYIFSELKDKSTWNEILVRLPKYESGLDRYSFIQSFNWLEFQAGLGREIYALSIKNSKNEIIGLAAGIIIRARRGSYLYIRNGPVIDWADKILVANTIDHLKAYAKAKGLWFVRISPLVELNSKASSILDKLNLKECPMNDVEALDTWVMDISKEEKDIFMDIKKKTRYEIRRGLETLETFVTTDPKYIDAFYEIEKDTVKRNNWTAYSKEYILKEFEAFRSDNNASIILIKHNNEFIAGGVFIHFPDQTYYHYGASLTKYRDLPASYLMIWEAIKVAKSKNHKFFNFWGITPLNASKKHPWQGLTAFKMKFPGIEVRWYPSKDIPVSPKYLLTNTFEKFDKLRKGY